MIGITSQRWLQRRARTILLRAQLDAALAVRRAARPNRNARSRKGAETKIHDAYARDVLVQGAGA